MNHSKASPALAFVFFTATVGCGSNDPSAPVDDRSRQVDDAGAGFTDDGAHANIDASNAVGACEADGCATFCGSVGRGESHCAGDLCICAPAGTCEPNTLVPCYGGPRATAGVGPCAGGVSTCTGSAEFTSWGACVGQVLPGQESCDGVDNDCNGQVDDHAPCVDGGGSDGAACVPSCEGKCPGADDGCHGVCTVTGCSGGCCDSTGVCRRTSEGSSCGNAGLACTDCVPTTSSSGCGWVWGYEVDYNPCVDPCATHFDAGGGSCSTPDEDCVRQPDGRYACSEWVKWWDGTNDPNYDIRFDTVSFGLLDATMVDYCVLAWGFHPGTVDGSGTVLSLDVGAPQTFNYKAVAINFPLYDHFVPLDPVVPGWDGAPSVTIVWDASAENLRNERIPYDYKSLQSGGCGEQSCGETGPGVLDAASTTYEDLIRYVQTVELPKASWGTSFETGDTNIVLAFFGTTYTGQHPIVGLTAHLTCVTRTGQHVDFGRTVGLLH